MQILQLLESKYARSPHKERKEKSRPNFVNWVNSEENRQAVAELQREIVDEFDSLSVDEQIQMIDGGDDLGEYDSWSLFPGIEDKKTFEWVVDLTKKLLMKAYHNEL